MADVARHLQTLDVKAPALASKYRRIQFNQAEKIPCSLQLSLVQVLLLKRMVWQWL
jgi:hypothetical protein